MNSKAIRHRAAALMLALLMVISMLPAGAVPAFAEETATPEVQATSEQSATEQSSAEQTTDDKPSQDVDTGASQAEGVALPAPEEQGAASTDEQDSSRETLADTGVLDESLALSKASAKAMAAESIVSPLTTAVAVPYVDAAGNPQTPEDAIVVESSTDNWNGGWYVVKDNVTISNRVYTNGTVNLILADGGSLTAEAGVNVINIDTLNIWAQSGGTGRLTANGDDLCAGIGGGNGAGGTITINGGVIMAQGGGSGAGIGGGNNGAGGTITINGGAITATGGAMAAGIGGGSNGAGGNITINGGTVTATGSDTDIGHGYYGSDGTLTINGGSIKATTGRVSPQPTNGADSVYLNTLTIGANPDEEKNAVITAVGGDISGYGINGVKTDNDGKVYFWLAESSGAKLVTATVASQLYGASYERQANNNNIAQLAKGAGNVIDMSNVSPQAFGTGWTYNGDVYTILNGADVTVTGSNTDSERRIEVAGGATANITLQDVLIGGLGTGQSPLGLRSGSNVTLTITGANTLTAGTKCASIQASSDTTLTINGMGSLTATGGTDGAGIGGGYSSAGGTITINGGTVTATGSGQAAGIGGSSRSGGNITISGNADVTAIGGSTGAGIGGGMMSTGGTITISGGKISATGDGGAGIGGGGGGTGGNITISGGEVTVNSIGISAGIGGGSSAPAGTVTINGGTVKATGGTGAKDIGSGRNASAGTVTINGGSVNPTRGEIIQPTNGSGNNVYLNTLTIGSSPQANKTLAAGSISGTDCDTVQYNASTHPTLSGYGIYEVKTESAGKVYCWLPATAGDEKVALSANGSNYSKSYTRTADNTNVQTLILITPITVQVTANGAASTQDTTQLTLTFSQAVTGLSADEITITGNGGAATKGMLSGSGTTYTLSVSGVSAGYISVAVADFGDYTFTNSPVSVTVYKQTHATYLVTSHFGTWTGTGTATASIDADYGKFIHLLYNGSVVDPAHYTTTSGSTVITLSEAHLKGYANGTYTFIAEFTDGTSAPINLTVNVAASGNNGDTGNANTNNGTGTGSSNVPGTGSSNVPGTGDNATPFVWTLLLAVAGAASIAVALLRKRERELKQRGLHAKK